MFFLNLFVLKNCQSSVLVILLAPATTSLLFLDIIVSSCYLVLGLLHWYIDAHKQFQYNLSPINPKRQCHCGMFLSHVSHNLASSIFKTGGQYYSFTSVWVIVLSFHSCITGTRNANEYCE